MMLARSTAKPESQPDATRLGHFAFRHRAKRRRGRAWKNRSGTLSTRCSAMALPTCRRSWLPAQPRLALLPFSLPSRSSSLDGAPEATVGQIMVKSKATCIVRYVMDLFREPAPSTGLLLVALMRSSITSQLPRKASTPYSSATESNWRAFPSTNLTLFRPFNSLLFLRV